MKSLLLKSFVLCRNRREGIPNLIYIIYSLILSLPPIPDKFARKAFIVVPPSGQQFEYLQ